METPTSTDKPLAAGDGRGQSKTGSTSSKNSTESGAPESTPTEREPSSSLLGADGQAIPISEGGLTDSVIDRGRDLGRQAGELGKRVSTMTQEYTEREPMRAVLISLGVGIVLGAVIGILFSRD